jgi:hypothetical protein
MTHITIESAAKTIVEGIDAAEVIRNKRRIPNYCRKAHVYIEGITGAKHTRPFFFSGVRFIAAKPSRPARRRSDFGPGLIGAAPWGVNK